MISTFGTLNMSITESQIRGIVNQVLSERDFTNLILGVLTKNSFQDQVESISKNVIEKKLESRSTMDTIQAKVRTYLDVNLSRLVGSHVTEAYTPFIQPLVELQLLKALSTQEGFERLVASHREAVSAEISKLQSEFENIRAAHMTQIQSVTEAEIVHHRNTIREHAETVVGNLGETLKRQLQDASEKKVRDLETKYQQEINELKSNSSNQWTWMYFMSFATIITSTILLFRR